MGYAAGDRWNDEIITETIYKVMDNLGINRMPSVQEICKCTKNTRLTNAIRRRGGMYEWANKLNLPAKESETSLGKEYEKHFMQCMIMQGWKVDRMSVKHPYDLLINGNVKIDVKASKRYYYDERNYYYTFNLEKKNPTCDIYVCYCINDTYWTDKLLIIPSKFLDIKQLSVGAKSDYDKYNERFDYIKQYDKFYKSIV